MNAIIEREEQGIVLNLYIQPGASKTAFAGVYNHRLKVRVQAPAIEGAANKSLCDFLSQQFHVSKSSVILRQGAKSREKQVYIAGDAETLRQRAESLITVA
ncbi:MAG TPA: DUF167 domain-containing protein [Trichormus sp.]|jgi:hypothetical protein